MLSPTSFQWLSLVATIWLQTINGANTDFPIYSSQLKKIKHFSQVGLNFLAFASDAGKLFGWFAGIAAIYLPLWLVAAVGAIFLLIGYGLQFLFLQSHHLSYLHIFMLTALAGNGICWINTVCYLISIQNFPNHSRIAVGLSTSYVGLSAKVYTVLATAFLQHRFNDKAKEYIFLNSIMPALVTVSVAPFLRVIHTNGKTQAGLEFMVIFVIASATGTCAVLGSIGRSSQEFSSAWYILILGVLLAAPLVIPLSTKLKEAIQDVHPNKKENRIHDLALDDVETGSSVPEVEVPEMKEEIVGNGAKECLEEVGGLMILRKLNFWLYFFSYMFSATLGLVFLNNLGQIAESRQLEETSKLVSFSSSFGFFGRLLPVFLDYFSSRKQCIISRPASLATLMAPMAGAFFILIDSSKFSLYLSTAIISVCTGAITSIAVSATTELFGNKFFSLNHNIVVTNIPLGSFIYGYLAAFIYQRGAGERKNICVGTVCYETTFIIWGITCSTGLLLCILLYIRTCKLFPKNVDDKCSNRPTS